MRSLIPADTERRRAKKHLWITRAKPLRIVERAALSVFYRHPVRNLLIIGQPKSGTTWLRRMLCDVPGYVKWSPPAAQWWSDHPLRERDVSRPPIGYSVTRLHSAPTPEHLETMRRVDRPYVIMVRDLRDVAVSWAYFMDTSYFGAPREIEQLDIPQRLDYFIDTLLEPYARWQRGWLDGRHPERGLVVHYEQLIADTRAEFERVLSHFRVDLKPAAVSRIVEKHAFKRATGRDPGQQDATAFNRKGIAGDWKNHLTPAQLDRFHAALGRVGLDTPA